MKIINVYFSPKGTTEKIAVQIANGISSVAEDINLLKNPLVQALKVDKSDCVVLSMPVYAGRIPAICAEQLKHLKGDGTPAIIVAVYGNRAYDDALVEMQDIVTENGFVVVAAGAFIAEHSIFTQVAQGRPNISDEAVIASFAARCKSLVVNIGNITETIIIPGNRPYKEISSVPLKPSGDKKCDECGACKEICPAQAILSNPRKTNNKKCLSCGACIKACPQKSRNYHGLIYKVAGGKFTEAYSAPRQPELFYIN